MVLQGEDAGLVDGYHLLAFVYKYAYAITLRGSSVLVVWIMLSSLESSKDRDRACVFLILDEVEFVICL